MIQTKPWYLSRTVWASVVTMLTATLSLTGVPVEGIDNAALVEALLQVVTAIAGAVALFGRLAAKDKIG